MLMAHRNGRRLAVLTGLFCGSGTRCRQRTPPRTRSRPTASPCTSTGGRRSHRPWARCPTESAVLRRGSPATRSSKPIDPLPATIVTSGGTDWSGVYLVVAGATVAALALVAAAFVLNGHRRRSAGAH